MFNPIQSSAGRGLVEDDDWAEDDCFRGYLVMMMMVMMMTVMMVMMMMILMMTTGGGATQSGTQT